MIRLSHTPLLDLRTPLGLIPEAWRLNIEPHITRPPPGHEAAGCWLWDPERTKCSVTATGEPVMYVRDPDAPRGRTTTLVKFVVAGLFWPMFRRDKHWVYHECGNINCLAPHHLLVTPSAPSQINVIALVKKKHISIRDYQKSLLRREAEAALRVGVEGEINDHDH